MTSDSTCMNYSRLVHRVYYTGEGSCIANQYSLKDFKSKLRSVVKASRNNLAIRKQFTKIQPDITLQLICICGIWCMCVVYEY